MTLLNIHVNSISMPPLKNIKHEKFARELAKPEITSNTQAYMNINPGMSYNSARATAPVVLANPSIKQRVIELLDKNGLSLEKLTNKLSEHIDGDDKPISFRGVELGFKLHGALDEDKGQSGDVIVNFALINETKPTT